MPKVDGGSLQSHRERTRERIFEALERLMYERGYDALTLADIATDVGLARTAMYNYFPDKDTVLVDYIAHETERYLRELRASLAAVDDPVERLRVYIREQRRYLTAHHVPPGPALQALLPKPVYRRMSDHVSTLDGVLRDIIEALVEQRYADVDDVQTTLSLVASCINRGASAEPAGGADTAGQTTEAFVLRALGVHVSADGRPRRRRR